MPIEFTWLLPDKILLSRWYGTVTAEDMRILSDELQVVFEHTTSLIHSIIDLYDLDDVADDIVTAYFKGAAATHPRRGRIAAVQIPARYRALAERANQLAGREILRAFETRSDARDYLLANDTPPPPLGPGA